MIASPGLISTNSFSAALSDDFACDEILANPTHAIATISTIKMRSTILMMPNSLPFWSTIFIFVSPSTTIVYQDHSITNYLAWSRDFRIFC